ncbi:rac GTPase-activating protein 1-like isoform X3 [Ostrinia furnacalis]|uniref:rac GTPase-activating protein 1-like isoform X2 n=1 Tax=Ostrinia furnacalis TaxID=93504 RepID=UPI00103B5650|nr:rac GTPase-activating protein 1-like isoform X2 [Ostrinia furnacalis]XP_028163598.1 rac GTPase-activating protein 1-like isoform X3 [Ostrinia furnacalis]
MSSENSDSGSGLTLSLVAQFDDINRLNGVLNDGAAEECFLAFVKQMEWVRSQWASAEAEAARLQTELDEAHKTLSKWEAKFAHVRKLLDGEKRERNIVLKKYSELSKLLEMARDLLFNDNRNKLNDETLQKLAFLNGTAQQDHNAKLSGVPELNSTGTLLSEMSYSRSEDDLDISLASTRRSWVQRGGWTARDNPPATKKRRSSTSSATKTVELQGGKVLATATTTLTLERAPTNHDLKPPTNFQPISESSDEAPAPTPTRKSSGRVSGIHIPQLHTPSAPPRTDSDSVSDTPRAPPQRTPSVVSAAYGGSPRARPRQHNFVAKNFYKRETCGPCGKTIKFAKVGVKCESCRAQAHPECRALLPLPCVPPGPHARRANGHQEGSIADYAPSAPPMVPALLVHCINEVEKRGLGERGIYRISAVDKDVKRLKERFLRGCGSPQLANEDIHVLCGCIKDFLRSLREPLVSNALWSDFMDAAKLSEPSDATAAVVQAVSQLPQPNRDTLAFLALHLQKVAESPECEMGVENLAKIFGPTIVGYGLMTQPAEMYTATAQMFNVMQLLLRLPAEYWAQWACAEPASPPAPLARPKGFFFSPADTGISRKKRNYFQ